MSSLAQLIEPLKHSHRLPEALMILQETLAEDRRKRDQFIEGLSPSDKAEFIDGKVIMHSPARNRHLMVTGWIYRLLSTFVDSRKLGTVNMEKCLCLFSRNAYEPDIVFFGRDKASEFTWDTKTFPIPDLIVEVLSDSTEKADRGVKFDDYSASGVGEYWIVDADRSFLEQYVLRDGEYALKVKSGTGPIASEVILGFATELEAFFEEEANLRELWKIRE